ncbi:hypothetical protein RIR_jg5542.t1 [Rhizophagus irregularis DAOM 181602=DAOM 197198]|nr:hypothetical protein RIR_jg5542.t1 [Rhizophagus irregularis DAOM 181602=DAOM 197198]
MYATTHIQKREKLLLNNSRAIKQDGNSISANSRKKKSKSKDVKKNMEVTHIKQTSKKGEINIKIKISSK